MTSVTAIDLPRAFVSTVVCDFVGVYNFDTSERINSSLSTFTSMTSSPAIAFDIVLDELVITNAPGKITKVHVNAPGKTTSVSPQLKSSFALVKQSRRTARIFAKSQDKYIFIFIVTFIFICLST